MGLIFLRAETVHVPPPQKHGFSWASWYAQNKQRLSEKRARRYQDDPVYRKAALQRSRQQRVKKPVSVPDAYTVSFMDAADQVGVTVWVLREWRKKNYYPEPHHRDHRLWFTPDQVLALRPFAAFMAQHGPRVSVGKKQLLEQAVSLTFANWP